MTGSRTRARCSRCTCRPFPRSSCSGIRPTASTCGSGDTARPPDGSRACSIRPATSARSTASANVLETGLLTLQDAILHKHGDQLTGTAHVTEADVRTALPVLQSVTPGRLGRRPADRPRDRDAVRRQRRPSTRRSAPRTGSWSSCPTFRSAGWRRSRSSRIRTSRCRASAPARPRAGSSCARPRGCASAAAPLAFGRSRSRGSGAAAR